MNPKTPPVSSQVTFLYYADLAGPERFYGEILGFEKTLDKDWVKLFRITDRSYVGLVDETKGHHKASGEKSVMVSFETADLEAWYDRMRATNADFLAHLDPSSVGSKLVSAFLLRDPGGYTVEFFRFNQQE